MNSRLDTVTLLSFLRTAKFSQQKAREMIENYATAITELPRWFKNIDTTDPEVLKIFESGHALLLPKRDKDGRQIMLYRIGSGTGDGGKVTTDQEIRAISIAQLYTSRDENVQVNGYVFVVDFTGFSLEYVTRWSTEDTKKWSNIWQNCMPGRFKAFHYYNPGTVFEAFMSIVKPFLTKKLQERIFVHETLESLYEYIGMELLPTEYLPDDYTGPNAGTVEEIIANYKREITEPAFRDLVLERTSDRYGIDESKASK